MNSNNDEKWIAQGNQTFQIKEISNIDTSTIKYFSIEVI
jgi:hypothetical protein